MFALLADVAEHAAQDAAQGLATHNYVLLAAGVVAVGVPVVLKVMGKSVPFLDPVLEALLALAEKFSPPAKPVDPAKADAELKQIADESKAAAVVVPIDQGKKQ